MKSIIAVFLVLILYTSFGQSTDRIKYYVLYDISGSVPMYDVYQNLKALGELMLKIEGDTSKTPFSIELIGFGETLEHKSLNLHGSEISKSRNDLVKYFDDLSKYVSNRPSHKYTHLLDALNKVSEMAAIEDVVGETFGIFIFTDGQLEKGDIKEGNIESYWKAIRKRIGLFRKQRKPVFLVQSSPNFLNKYFQPVDELPDVPKEDTLRVDANYFWLKSTVPYGSHHNPSITQAFQNFLIQALSIIQNSHKSDYSKEDDIAKLLLISELLQLKDIKVDKQQLKSVSENKNVESYFDMLMMEIPFDSSQDTNNKTKKHEGDSSIKEEKRYGGEDKRQSFLHFDSGLRYASLNNAVPKKPVQSNPLKKLLDQIHHYTGLTDLNEDELKDMKEKINKLLKYEDYEVIDRAISSLDIQPSQYNFTFADLTPADIGADQIVPGEKSGKTEDIEEAIILGLSDYLIKRTKQEVLFLFYENLNEKIFKPSTFIRDTLFYHVSKLLESLDPSKDEYFEPNLVLIKEAFNKDMDLITYNLTKHPRFRESDGLVALAYSTELIKNITRGMTLEKSFEELISKMPSASQGTTPLERALLFTCHFIDFLDKHDLSGVYNTNDPGDLKQLSKLIAVWIAGKFGDVHTLNNLDMISEKIQSIYENYTLIRQTITGIKKEMDSIKPSGSFSEYQEYKREATLQILRQCTNLLLSGLDVAQHYTDEDYGEINKNLHELNQITHTAVEAWFLVKDKEYARAAAHLVPMIPKMPFVKIDTSNTFIKKYASLKSAVNLTPMQKDLRKLSKVMINPSINLDTIKYLAQTKEDALQFLVKYQLRFLKPLLLHEIAKTKMIGGITMDNLVSRYPVLEDVDKKVQKKLVKYCSSSVEIDVTTDQWRFLTQSAFKEFSEAFLEKERVWTIGLPGDLITKDVVNIYKAAMRSFTNYNVKVKDIIGELRGNKLKSDIKSLLDRQGQKQLIAKFKDPIVKEYLARQLLSYFSVEDMNDDLKRLISIAGEISTAKSAGDVENVIQKYALPVASYRIKREEPNSLMVNSYVGGGASILTEEKGMGYMLNAPIGLELSNRFRSRKASWSIFASILDVGNVINYRISDDEEQSDRSFQFEEVISPGLFVMFGLSRRFPFSAGAGYQLNPGRVTFSMAFDLPLFRLK